MPEVESTAIQRIAYEAKSAILSVWFVETEGRYDYYDVPESVYEAFLGASSKGGFFNDHVKDRYRFTRRRR